MKSVGSAPHSPQASSFGPLDKYSGQGLLAPLQANFRPTQTISQPMGQLELGEDGGVFLTHAPRYNKGIQAAVELTCIHYKAFRNKNSI
jgi:hypothetical protein